ncbi:response regulator [Ammoniphilus sp. CFH 90114]|uniref:response regulator n=1 Tax=Ammoniphilus sp. CFH 90114 TaxID=2493665 RepID=UPI00100EB474|nr:response regulator [Ammoniphilus sp. CFH 90114]RXT08042.1 response regulator [Ammoniphilus sp. CFH 90114]
MDKDRNEFRQTLENLQNVIFKFKRRADGAIIYTLYEGRIATQLGLTTNVTYGKTLQEIFSSDQAQYLTPLYERATNGETVSYEFTYQNRVFYNLLSPIVHNGKVIEVVGSAVDITERKRMERELEWARDQALLASRLKSEFLAAVSHEIRTPMNAISGMISLMLKTALNEEQKRFSTVIADSANSLMSILNDILDFSKLEAGKMTMEINEFDLQKSVEDIIELLAPKAYEKKLSLALFLDPTIPKLVSGDPGKLRQILINLINNAIKFTLQGEVSISAQVLSLDRHDVYVRFEVKDTGIGISPKLHDCIFQPFTQADGSITRQFGGTGLGLSIVKQLVELMDGEVGVESAEQVGSMFWFTCRFHRVPEMAAHQVELKTDPSGKIVIVSRGNDEMRALTYFFSPFGTTCEHWEDPDHALMFIKQQLMNGKKIKAIIADTDLWDTIPWVQQLRRNPLTNGIKMIAILSPLHYIKRKIIERGLFDAFLSRPIKPSQLSFLKEKFCTDDGFGVTTPSLSQRDKFSKKKSILLVEDNVINQEIISLYLKEKDYMIHTALNGKVALALVSKQNYDLIFMDCQMPEMSGYETARQIRNLEMLTGQHVPIIAITAHLQPGEREACMAAGMSDFLGKPFTSEQLHETLEQWLPELEREVPSSLDTERFLSMDPESARQLSILFATDTEKILNRIEAALPTLDRQTFYKEVHKVKSGCSFIGAKKLSSLLEEMEQLDPVDQASDINHQLALIREEFNKVKLEIPIFSPNNH